jgi:lipid kinase YegS
MTHDALEARVETIVAGGGDGTIHEVCNALLEVEESHKVAVGVLPLGTANDFATATGIPTNDPLAALRLIVDQAPTLIDVGRVNDRHFLNVVSGGYGAEVTTVTNPVLKHTLGRFAYFLTGLTQAQTIVPRQAQITGPDFDWEGNVMAVAVSNGRQAGGGFRVGAHAFLNDGLLDLMILPELPLSDLPTVIQDIRNIDATAAPQAFLYRQLPQVTIDAPDGLQLNLDGEPVHGMHFDISVLPERLRMVLPADSPLLR